jgi:hypothetical protein
MQDNIFDQISNEERAFLEELSQFSKLKERERLYSQTNLSKKAKTEFIYENKIYLSSENRVIMNQIARPSSETFFKNMGAFTSSFFIFSILNVSPFPYNKK